MLNLGIRINLGWTYSRKKAEKNDRGRLVAEIIRNERSKRKK